MGTQIQILTSDQVHPAGRKKKRTGRDGGPFSIHGVLN
jgi:hypothetical protein